MSTIKTIEEYIAEAKKLTDLQRSEKLKAAENSAAEKISRIKDSYNKSTEDTKIAYESEYERNAVQKLINEKSIAERNANLGLTDSGLNRTQQTATELSYANQKGDIDLARRNALDTLNINLTSAIDTINQELETNKFSINQTYDQLNAQTATDMRNADIEAETELQKAVINVGSTQSSDNPLLYNWTGETSYDGKDNLMLKFVDSNGESRRVAAGRNPYTYSINAQIKDIVKGKCVIDEEWQKANIDSDNMITRACAKYGVFSNGYQPKGVCYYDENGNIVDAGKLVATTRKDYKNGKLQTVWCSEKTGQRWIWNGSTNEYELYVM